MIINYEKKYIDLSKIIRWRVAIKKPNADVCEVVIDCDDFEVALKKFLNEEEAKQFADEVDKQIQCALLESKTFFKMDFTEVEEWKLKSK